MRKQCVVRTCVVRFCAGRTEDEQVEGEREGLALPSRRRAPTRWPVRSPPVLAVWTSKRSDTELLADKKTTYPKEPGILSEHEGSCFCGAVAFTVTGAPAAMGYCHCQSCRHWSAGPINAFTLWKPESVKVTKGANLLGSYNKTAGSTRRWCKSCGGHLLTEHPGMGLTDVYAGVIKDFRFEPQLEDATASSERARDTRLRVGAGV
jgi:hypothetical protein